MAVRNSREIDLEPESCVPTGFHPDFNPRSRWSWRGAYEGARNGLAISGVLIPGMLFITGKWVEAVPHAPDRPDELVRIALINGLFAGCIATAWAVKKGSGQKIV